MKIKLLKEGKIYKQKINLKKMIKRRKETLKKAKDEDVTIDRRKELYVEDNPRKKKI